MADIERIQKIMARRGAGSRRQCEEYIREGRVSVNGKVAELGDRADSDQDDIRLDGVSVMAKPPLTYLALHKPVGVVTTVKDPQNRQTVMELLPALYDRYGIVPVGRLDMDSEGLLLLTNDGALVYGLTHPRFGVDKVYQLYIDKPIDDKDIKSLEQGIHLTEGKTAPARVIQVGGTPHRTEIVISIHEGKKRQLRRMCSALGYRVTRLVRQSFGPIRLDLPVSQWRLLTEGEVESLRRAVTDAAI